MLRLKINYITYYVGSGKELRRLWIRALKHGYENGYKGYEETIPKYNPAGTYAIQILSRQKKMFWQNFNTIASYGHFSGKQMPDYKQYKNNMELARHIYELNNK